jgi:putative Mg2+ transporter-C (MgtC) family protein
MPRIEAMADNAAMDLILEELSLSLPDARSAVRVTIRLLAALLAGAIVGWQRERTGKPAGMRTHILVCMGTAMFVIVGAELDMAQDAMSRVIQGLATGIGFLGAGAIIKQESTREITGLTTAAGIWMTAAIGVAAGLGHLGSAALGVLLTWVVLAGLGKVEAHYGWNDRS